MSYRQKQDATLQMQVAEYNAVQSSALHILAVCVRVHVRAQQHMHMRGQHIASHAARPRLSPKP